MAEEARPGRVWPVALMALIVGLLGTFVVIRLARPDDRPPEIVPDRPPPTEDVSNGAKGNGPDAKAEESARKTKEAAAAKLAEARAAADAGRTKEALALARESRELLDTPEAADLERVTAEVVAAEDRKRMDALDARLRDLRVTVDKLGDNNRWDAAGAAIEAAREALKEHPDFDALRRHYSAMRAEAAKAYDTHFASAKHLRAQDRLREARAKVGLAIRFYPERQEAQHLLAEIDRQLLTVNMVRVPAPPKGVTVRLGDASRDGEPEREYKGGAFFIDRFEVTNEEYQIFVHATGHRVPQSKKWAPDRSIAPGYERHPVTGVTAEDAEKYAAWAGKRLPTEDEWEYAARYVDGRMWPWGDIFSTTEGVYNCHSLESVKATQRIEPVAVGSLATSRSALEIMDQAGNVWEWTATTVKDAEGRTMRVIKGGSFMTRSDACRASNRFLDEADVAQQDVGFRCVRDR